MLTEVRLPELFEPHGLMAKTRNAAIVKMFGMVPAAIAVDMVETTLDRSPFADAKTWVAKRRSTFTRFEIEAVSAFVSALNHCRF